MKVKAYKLGFYDHKRRREGEVFHINSEQEFSFEWMMKYDAEKNAFLKLKKPEKVEEDKMKKQAEAKAEAEKAALVAAAQVVEEESASQVEEPTDIIADDDYSSDDDVI